MKGDITIKILETIGRASITALELFVALGSAGYGASLGKLEATHRRIRKERELLGEKPDEALRVHIKTQKLLSKLKKEGFIREQSENDKKLLFITKKGEEKISQIKDAQAKFLFPRDKYASQEGNVFIIIVFDIPEREKKKREWLREVLKNLKFSRVQRSVWIGKIKIPKEFLDDLSKLRLLDFVHIFEIKKTGTLEHQITDTYNKQ